MKTIAVVGLGNISIRHRENIRKLYPQARLLAVSASGRHPKSVVANADNVFLSLSEAIAENLDMALVASPATLHAKHAIQLIDANVPVLIEKPLAASMQDAKIILEAASINSAIASVGYCLRYLPVIQELKKLLQTQKLGIIYNVYCEVGQYLPYWRPDKEFKNSVSANKCLGGGALLELSHEIDYLHYLFGDLEPHASILRSSSALNLDVEDQVDVLAVSRSNEVVTIHLDFLQKKAFRKIRIIAENGIAECDLIANQLVVDVSSEEKYFYEDKGYDKNKIYLNMLNDFNLLIAGKENSTISLKEGLKTVHFIHKVKELAGVSND